MEEISKATILNEPFTPLVMYHPDGMTRRVESAQLEKALRLQGWDCTPFPPLPEPPKPLTLEERVATIEDLVAQHDAVLIKRIKK